MLKVSLRYLRPYHKNTKAGRRRRRMKRTTTITIMTTKQKKKNRAGKMTQQVKALVDKHNDLSLISVTQV